VGVQVKPSEESVARRLRQELGRVRGESARIWEGIQGSRCSLRRPPPLTLLSGLRVGGVRCVVEGIGQVVRRVAHVRALWQGGRETPAALVNLPLD